ncbi:hypothetical protein Gotur_027379 [Gossypium turneri]
MNSFKIRIFGMLRSHWSAMLLSRCTRWIEQSNTHWPVFFSKYIKIWENRYDHIPTSEPIIVLELACPPDYMSWFRIHGKSYLLSKEQMRWQICVERERRGPLNP